MKKTNHILIAIVFLIFSTTFYGQTHTITLNVDTANLNANNASSSSISYFEAPNSNVEVDSPPEDFTIIVEEGATIIWEGVSTSSDDTVDIFMIKRERGPRIFASDEIPGNGTVQAVVNAQTPNEAFKYKILFKVNGTGRMYKIDPKIKVGGN